MLKTLILFLLSLSYSTSTDIPIEVSIITDVHAYPNKMPHEVHKIKRLVENSSFVVYNGDMVNTVNCPKDEKCDFPKQIYDFISIINKSFIFTLGNHDGHNPIRENIINKLVSHPNHIGVCNKRNKACRHPDYNIYTLDSNVNECEKIKYTYGCPKIQDTNWINKNLNDSNKNNKPFLALFTHIPPPIILGADVTGLVGERPCCWVSKNRKILPNKKPLFHIFGHDHNNLFLSDEINGTRYMNALKTGDHRNYGPSFGDSGISKLMISYNTIKILNSQSLEGEIYDVYNENNKKKIDYSFCGGSIETKFMKNTSARKQFIIISFGICLCLLVILFVNLCFKLVGKNENIRKTRYQRIN